MHQEQYNLTNPQKYKEQFIKAATSGNVEELKLLIEIQLEQREKYYIINDNDKINYDKDAAFRAAAENGHLEVIKCLVSLTPQYYPQIEVMTCYGSALIRAASNGHIDIVKYLLEEVFGPQESSVMLFNHSDIISLACKEVEESDYIKTLEHLLPLILDHDYKMRIMDEMFPILAGRGDIRAMKRILAMISDPAQREKILHRNDDCAFHKAAFNGRLNVMKFLIKKTPDPEPRELMLHCQKDYAFRLAAGSNHIKVLEYLIKLTPNAEKRKLMLQEARRETPNIAATFGHIEVLKYLIKWTPDQTMIDTILNDVYRKFLRHDQQDIRLKLFVFLLNNTSSIGTLDMMKEKINLRALLEGGPDILWHTLDCPTTSERLMRCDNLESWGISTLIYFGFLLSPACEITGPKQFRGTIVSYINNINIPLIVENDKARSFLILQTMLVPITRLYRVCKRSKQFGMLSLPSELKRDILLEEIYIKIIDFIPGKELYISNMLETVISCYTLFKEEKAAQMIMDVDYNVSHALSFLERLEQFMNE